MWWKWVGGAISCVAAVAIVVGCVFGVVVAIRSSDAADQRYAQRRASAVVKATHSCAPGYHASRVQVHSHWEYVEVTCVSRTTYDYYTVAVSYA